MNELSTATLDEFMQTECTYGDEYEDQEKHPHSEYWCCRVCLAKKLSALQSSNNELEEKLRVAKEALKSISDGHGCPLHQCGLIAEAAFKSL